MGMPRLSLRRIGIGHRHLAYARALSPQTATASLKRGWVLRHAGVFAAAAEWAAQQRASDHQKPKLRMASSARGQEIQWVRVPLVVDRPHVVDSD